MTLTTFTVNGVDYTSYASVAEADAILAVHPVWGPIWAAIATDTLKQLRLISATNRIDLEQWLGQKTVTTQPRDFPRTGLTCEGQPVGSTTIPTRVEEATAIMAARIEQDPQNGTIDPAVPQGELEKVVAGPVEVEYFSSGNGTTPGSTPTPFNDMEVFRLLSCFLDGASNSTSVAFGCPEFNNLNGKTEFEEPVRFPYVEGLP